MHQGALGDFLLTLPILTGLYRSYPLIQMNLWTKPEHIALLAEEPFLGKGCPPDDSELHPFFHDELWITARVPRFLQGAQAILIFGQTGSRQLAEKLSRRLDCPVHWFQSFPGTGMNPHVHHFHLDQCRRLGWAVEECLPKLKPSRGEITLVQECLQKRIPASFGDAPRPILLHPGTGGLRKIWPLKKWWALVRFLRGYDRCPICMTLGPADERLKDFAKAVKELGVVVIERISLPTLAALMSECRLFIGSDSGVSHLAALVGIPTAVIFGPTNPDVWAPRGSHVRIVRENWEEPEVLDWSRDQAEASLDPHVMESLTGLLSSQGM